MVLRQSYVSSAADKFEKMIPTFYLPCSFSSESCSIIERVSFAVNHVATKVTDLQTGHVEQPLLVVLRIVIVISEFLKRYSKAKRTRAPAYSRVLRRIKGGFPKGGSREAQVRFPEY